jgi:2-polyprenyl-3-methyl-5-hydroxy-6-metoxy-1,4-benzoquinol methylase
MTKTLLPTNLVKHTSKNPLQKLLINNFYSILLSEIKELEIESILDAGCGEGFTMDKLEKNGIGKQIEGVEYSKEAISYGKKLFPNLVIKQASIYDLPYKDNSFDIVLCTEVLEHLEEPIKALKEISRVSKKYLILSVPNEPFFRLSNFLRGKNLRRLGNDEGHINHWNVWSLKKLLTQNKIYVEKTSLPFPWIMMLGTK